MWWTWWATEAGEERKHVRESEKSQTCMCVSPALNPISWQKTGLIELQVQPVEGGAENQEWDTCRLKISVASEELMKHISTDDSKSKLMPSNYWMLLIILPHLNAGALPVGRACTLIAAPAADGEKLALCGDFCLSALSRRSFISWLVWA